MFLRKWIYFILVITLSACSKEKEPSDFQLSNSESQLYSRNGREHQIRFEALYRSRFRRLEDIRPQSLSFEIKRTTQFLFGPLTHRSIGGIQKGEKITSFTDRAFIQDGSVMIPYLYEATWLVHSDFLSEGLLALPVPYSLDSLRSPQWQKCTDNSDEEHSSWGFFWYYWDPERPGCDHQAHHQYQIVEIQVGPETPQTQISFPEYQRLIRREDGVPTVALTFAFGYVKDVPRPDPFKDNDFGMKEFQRFYHQSKVRFINLGLKESPVYQSEFNEGRTIIGSRFTGVKNGIYYRISIVAAAGVDQMDIFAHSYARKHEAFFGWFGHSRVGSGFDADILKSKLLLRPDEFSISPEYQLIYWAGCNSYSYYTLPFFELKSELDLRKDPNGTKNLDLISNALPSLFAFNARNAQILLQALIEPEKKVSYQSIINQIEDYADSWNYDVVVNVLGDEDNP